MAYDNYVGDRPSKHWGDYEFTDHDYDQLGADPLVDMKVVPDLATLVQTEKAGGLLVFTADSRTQVAQHLTATVYQQLGTWGPNTDYGEATQATDGEPHSWLADLVSNGKAVILGLVAAYNDKAEVVTTTDPAVIANLAGSEQTHYALLEAPSELSAAATQAALQTPGVAPSPAAVPLDAPRVEQESSALVPALIVAAALATAALLSRRKV